ncbi:MAG: hypothetical protein PF447_07120 [Spirochaetaceae bacterium]|jgi:alpha-L-glutamate ligase-like protein|nr:hypothetical protein [Spirochaetaceae bacterium]
MKFRTKSLEDILSLNQRNIRYINQYNPRIYFPQVDDKIRTKEILTKNNIPVPKTLAVIDNFLFLSDQLKELQKYPEMVIKPSKGSGGGGILLLNKISDNHWQSPSGRAVSLSEIETHIGEILFGVYSFGSNDDRVLVESMITPHVFFKNIYADGVADIRIILFKGQVVMAMARIPTEKSEGKANLHQGAIGVGIELSSGVFTSAAHHGKKITHHPDSSLDLIGQEIPHWKEVLQIAVKAFDSVDLDYLGVDIVIDETSGPLILELNARPGLEIQVVNSKYLNRELEQYL